MKKQNLEKFKDDGLGIPIFTKKPDTIFSDGFGYDEYVYRPDYKKPEELKPLFNTMKNVGNVKDF